MNIGISLPTPRDAPAWANDPHRHLVSRLMLLRKSPWVDTVHLLSAHETYVLPACMDVAGLGDLQVVRPQDVTHELDMVIELGGQLPVPWLRHVRALGARVVLFMVEQAHSALIESPIFGRASGALFNGAFWDEIWILPQHARSSLALMRTLSRVPVHEVPQLWSSVGLEQQVALLRQRDLAFGFDPQSRCAPAPGWRVGIFDPNVSVTGNCFVSLLVCDYACRQDPDAVARVVVTNTEHMKDHPTFNRFAVFLDCTRQGKASYEPRLAFAECAAQFSLDAVVAHDWEGGLNDACYDALYGGYPLVHNNDTLKRAGVGLHYPGFSATAGGNALVQAWRQEPGYWQDYQKTAAAWLRRLAPDDPSNVAAFMRRVQQAAGAMQ